MSGEDCQGLCPPFAPKGVICGAASICLRKQSTLARLFRRPVATCLPELHDDLPQIRIVRIALLKILDFREVVCGVRSK